mgnify:CR=1 FL=1
MATIKLNAIQVIQPIGEFYIGVMDAADLVAISYSDVRKMKREVEDYLGIQRELKKPREKEIKEYISTLDATFPNSIFVESDISTQAKVFAMVNQNQTKVNPSLVYDLESLSVSRSPDKTAHQIAVLLNKTEGSPFYRRIKRLGVKTIDADGHQVQGEMLAQAAFVSNLVKLISPKPREDRNLLLGKKKKFLSFSDKTFGYIDHRSLKRCVFRECFIKEKDEVIALNVSNYFEAVKRCWPEEWESSNKKSVLNKTVGFIALIRYLRTAINLIREHLNLDGFSIISVEQFIFILESTEVPSEFFYTVDAVSKSSGEIFNMLDKNTFLNFRVGEELNDVEIKNNLINM